MRVLSFGNAAEDEIARVKARQAMTASTSANIMDYFNSEGGNTPLQSTKPGTMDSIFNTITGIFGKLGTIASAKPAVYTVRPAPTPYAAFAMVGLAGLLIYKVAK